MIYLLLSVVFSTMLFVIFNYFKIYKIHVLKAIVVNYVVAFSLGIGTTEGSVAFSSLPEQPWFYGAMVLGLLFVSIFSVMAITTQRNGVSVASVSGKMSVVIPVLFGVFLYGESLSFVKILGIGIALVAVYLASVKDGKSPSLPKATLLFPFLLFLGSGAIDTTLKYVETTSVKPEEVALFSGSLFGFAAIFGILLLGVNQLKNNHPFGLKNIIAGIVLGVPNYYSIVFLIKALQIEGVESATLFTVNNVGVVVLSTLVGVLLFKEKFSIKNTIGVVLAIVGIILVSIA